MYGCHLTKMARTIVRIQSRKASSIRTVEVLARESTALKRTVPMPQNISSHRIIVVARSTAQPLTQTCQRSKALQQRRAPRRIVVIRNGQCIAHHMHDR